MKTFFIKLITKGSGLSSKRFVSIVAFPCLVACVILNSFGITIQAELIYALASIVIGESGFTLLEKNNNTEGKG